MKKSILVQLIILFVTTIILSGCVVAPSGWDDSGYYGSGDYPQPVVIEEPPEFIQPPEVGFYVATGVPYDLFFVSNL
ncbi:hypothetical protein EG832_22160, partial [bacterium]|nr:hypothetical protein [bacterium]